MFLAKNIKYLRKKENLSIRQLAKRIRFSHAIIAKIESNESNEENITVNTVIKIANYFGVSLDDLVCKDLSEKEE